MRAVLAGCVCASAMLAAACASSTARPTVAAAASLTEAFRSLDESGVLAELDPAFSFAGSPEVVEQVRRGAPVDVIAVADPELLTPLRDEGLLVGAPVVFARNRLVVVVPDSRTTRVESVGDLARPGLRVVLASAPVPAGRYAREGLASLGLLDAVRENVVSEEADVKLVAAKVALGEADAGVVYASDAAIDARLRRVGDPLPVEATYAAAVVRDAANADQGRRLVDLLRSARARRALASLGFEAVPEARPSE